MEAKEVQLVLIDARLALELRRIADELHVTMDWLAETCIIVGLAARKAQPAAGVTPMCSQCGRTLAMWELCSACAAGETTTTTGAGEG